MYATRLGAGLHEADIDPANMEMLLKVHQPQLTMAIFHLLTHDPRWSWPP